MPSAPGDSARAAARLHVVTDDEVLAASDFLDRAASVLSVPDGGALHLRGPNASTRRLYDLAERLEPMTRDSGWRLVINDRVDLALALGIRSVHLPARAMPVAEARSLLGREARIGRSVHSLDEARSGVEEGADYVVLGAVFQTPTHPGRAAAGLVQLEAVARDLPTPVIAIGGITPERVESCLDGGAHGVAVLSGVWGARDPDRAVMGYHRQLLSECHP